MHSNVAPASELKLNVGVLSLFGEGIGVSVVSGASVSTTNVCVPGVASTFPAASLARTSNVCEPSLSAVGAVYGEAQAV